MSPREPGHPTPRVTDGSLPRHDLVLAASVLFGSAIANSFLFEHPGHAELWIREAYDPALSRIDRSITRCDCSRW